MMRLFFVSVLSVALAACGQESSSAPGIRSDQAINEMPGTDEVSKSTPIHLLDAVDGPPLSPVELWRLENGEFPIPSEDFITSDPIQLRVAEVGERGYRHAVCRLPEGSLVTAESVAGGAAVRVIFSVRLDQRQLPGICASNLPADMSPEGWVRAFTARSPGNRIPV